MGAMVRRLSAYLRRPVHPGDAHPHVRTLEMLGGRSCVTGLRRRPVLLGGQRTETVLRRLAAAAETRSLARALRVPKREDPPAH
eukprot:gene8081-22219_t